MTDATTDSTTRRRALQAIVGAGSAALAVGAGENTRAASNEDSLTIVHGTQFHGQFGRTDEPNVARYAAIVEELRETHSNVAFVATGDDIAKAPLATPLRGRHVIDALNHLDPAVAAIGNHEFDYGGTTFDERVTDSSFRWSSANLTDGADEPVADSERWVTESVGNLTVGFFGLTPQNTPELASEFPEDYRIEPNVPAAREAVAGLREAGADRIVCASHLALAGSKTVAERVEDIDLIVGDHVEHVFDEPLDVDGTPIATVGAEFASVGRATLDEENLTEWERVEVSTDTEPDPDMEAIVEEWRRQYQYNGLTVTVPP